MAVSSPQLAFHSSGSAKAPSIVFLHGGGVGSWMWEPVIQLLPDYHCLAPDLPEHGESRALEWSSMKQVADQVAGLIRAQAHGGKATVVGLSEGAQVAVQLFATWPELVGRAIISSALLRPIPGLGWAKSPTFLAWVYRVSIPPFRSNDWWIHLNMKYSAGLPDHFFLQFRKDFREMTQSGFVNLMLANQTFRLPAELDKVTVPTLVLAGRREYVAMKQSARDLVSAMPNACGGFINLGRTYTKAGEHNWALAAPELFAATVRAWVEGTPLPKVVESFQG